MFYRRKVLLGLLEALNRQVPGTDMQNYLFLVSREQENPSYHFIPYHFGCYSFQARCRQTNPGQVRTNVLNAEELEKVEALRPEANQPRLFTIGYEGQSLEQFLNKLIRQSVAVLCDVRRNPVSMKFGFSKRQLQHACDGTGLGYVHMPELGISSHRRKHLESPSDFQALFRDYVNTTLSENKEALDSIIRLVHDSGRVALTCFEAEADRCHRGCVASALLARPDFQHRVAHL